MKSFFAFVLLVAAASVSAQVATPAALSNALVSASQASVISLSGVNPVTCPQISMSQTWGGGVLLFSDSPESPTTRGMLYEDTNLTADTSETNRIFVYHENENTSESMRFSVLIKNNGTSSGTLTVIQHGLAGPSTDFPLAGELAFYRWLTNSPVTSVTVAAGAVVRLDTNFDTINVPRGEVLNGIWDYTFTKPHSVMVCALNPTDNPVTVGPTLPLLAADSHVRGTLAYCNKVYNTSNTVVVDTAAGIQQFPIGGSGDIAVTGYDNSAVPPVAVTNSGNYGVLYRSHLATSASNGQNLGFLVNPRGGGWCGAMFAESGIMAGGKFVIPSDGGIFSDQTEAAVEGEYSPGSGFTVWFQTMPVASASMPVRMVAVPY